MKGSLVWHPTAPQRPDRRHKAHLVPETLKPPATRETLEFSLSVPRRCRADPGCNADGSHALHLQRANQFGESSWAARPLEGGLEI